MGRGNYFRIFKCVALVGILVNLIVLCRADKEPSLLLRAPSGTGTSGSGAGPVFSSSIESIPVSSASSRDQQQVYKSPSYVHSASASASVGGDGGSSGGSGGRNNSPWYNSNSNTGFSFSDFGAQGDAGSAATSSHGSVSSSGNAYYEQPPPASTHQVSSSVSADGYAPPGGTTHGPSYTYFYQHYPTSSNHGGGGASGGGGWSGDEAGAGSIFPDLALPGFGGFGGVGGGIAGAKGVKIIAAIAKGILAAKPLLLIALLALVTIPILLFLAPIPIITISAQPSIFRSARSSSQQLTSYLSQLSGKVLNAEECLERIICKLPHAPEKYQKKAKILWDEHGKKMVTNQRVLRGLNAYFDQSSLKNRHLKCDQQFKCSNKYL